jgi:hypothetical protein
MSRPQKRLRPFHLPKSILRHCDSFAYIKLTSFYTHNSTYLNHLFAYPQQMASVPPPALHCVNHTHHPVIHFLVVNIVYSSVLVVYSHSLARRGISACYFDFSMLQVVLPSPCYTLPCTMNQMLILSLFSLVGSLITGIGPTADPAERKETCARE